jgi:uncharacterized protein
VELTNEFEVGVPVDQAWDVLTDLERIAPCLPGAQLQEVDGPDYKGIVKVKVGPITAQYKGVATFQVRDENDRRVVLAASGRDTRGQGNANATITAQLVAVGDRTRVHLSTDLTITGKVAQFGRGALTDVSEKLLGQFVENLETSVLAGVGSGDADTGAGTPAAMRSAVEGPPTSVEATPNRPRLVVADEPEPIDLLDTAGLPVARRLLPLLGLAVAVVAVLALVRHRRRTR